MANEYETANRSLSRYEVLWSMKVFLFYHLLSRHEALWSVNITLLSITVTT